MSPETNQRRQLSRVRKKKMEQYKEEAKEPIKSLPKKLEFPECSWDTNSCNWLVEFYMDKHCNIALHHSNLYN